MKSLIQKLCENKEPALHEFLDGSKVCQMSKAESDTYCENTGPDIGDTSLCRISLINGRVVLAESNFSEPVKGFLHFWTPLEGETFMLVPHSAIVSIAYSE